MGSNLSPAENKLPEKSSAEVIASNISIALKKASRQSRVPVSIVLWRWRVQSKTGGCCRHSLHHDFVCCAGHGACLAIWIVSWGDCR